MTSSQVPSSPRGFVSYPLLKKGKSPCLIFSLALVFAVSYRTVQFGVPTDLNNLAFVQSTNTPTPTPTPTHTPTATGGTSRGYDTTAGELQAIARKAASGIQPYKDAVLSVEHFANSGSDSAAASTPDPTYWPYGTITGNQDCPHGKVQNPPYIGRGAPLVEAKAMVYRLTGDARYAADARIHILDLVRTTGYGGEVYSGANQCILNLSREFPPFIFAADLLEGYPGWTPADKQSFQKWLATVVYKKVDYANDGQIHNWGAEGSMASTVIADYLTGSGILVVDRKGDTINSHDAWAKAKQRAFERVDGSGASYMKNMAGHCNPKETQFGIRPDGGIPSELYRAGPNYCNNRWIVNAPTGPFQSDYTYTAAYLTGVTLQAEVMLRRGDSSLYDYVSANGSGSILKGIYFLLHNPNDVSKSVDWPSDRKHPLEYVYRYYAAKGVLDPYISKSLGIGGARVINGIAVNQSTNFTTLTHGFAVGENPRPVPTVPAP